jgi:hypothetical protein
MAAAVAILFATWTRSPVHLPLPQGRHTRWLRGVPVIATAVIIGVLTTWYTDCSYLALLTTIAVGGFVICVALLLVHHRLIEEGVSATTAITLVCFGWSVSGTLAVSGTAAMLIAKQRMDEAYAAKPLVLWQFFDGRKQRPRDVIYLTAKLPAHFRAEVDECHKDVAPLTLSPPVGRLSAGTYFAPDVIHEEQQITISAQSEHYGDVRSTTVILLPDSPAIERKSYPIQDKEGRPAVIDLIVISRNDSWVFKSDTMVEKGRLRGSAGGAESAESTSVCRPVLELAESRAFEPYADIIAVGTASREGPEIEEDGRAARRGQNIARWVNSALAYRPQPKHVYFMNLGQYRREAGEGGQPTTDDTARERPVILMGVARAGDIDLQRAVSRVLQENQNDEFFKFILAHYPRRDIEPFHEAPLTSCR